MLAIMADGFRLITHPMTMIVYQNIVATLGLFTKPTPPLRYLAVFASIALAVPFFMTIHDRIENRVIKTFASGTVISTIMNQTDKLLIKRWNFDARGPEAGRNKQSNGSKSAKHMKRERSKSVSARFWFTAQALFSPRGVGRPSQVKNVPAFSLKDPNYVPARARFLLRTFILSVFLFIVQDIAYAQPPPPKHLTAADKQPLFGNMKSYSLEDFIFRFASTVGFWISTAATLNLIHIASAFMMVAVGVSKPGDWPPQFTSPDEAYSVRSFWG